MTGRGWEVKIWQRKSLPIWAPPPGRLIVYKTNSNEKDKGGLRSGRRHGMTHKHAEPHPSLTSSAPSCESPPPYLRSGLRKAAHGSCFSSGVCHIVRSCLSHAQTASPHSSHTCIENRNYHSAELDVSRGDPASRHHRVSSTCVHAWVHVAAIQFFLRVKQICFL